MINKKNVYFNELLVVKFITWTSITPGILFGVGTVGCKKKENCQNQIDTFLHFFHSVKTTER
jgi:hypothetical protein